VEGFLDVTDTQIINGRELLPSHAKPAFERRIVSEENQLRVPICDGPEFEIPSYRADAACTNLCRLEPP
jgi:hypothetical protein